MNEPQRSAAPAAAAGGPPPHARGAGGPPPGAAAAAMEGPTSGFEGREALLDGVDAAAEPIGYLLVTRLDLLHQLRAESLHSGVHLVRADGGAGADGRLRR